MQARCPSRTCSETIEQQKFTEQGRQDALTSASLEEDPMRLSLEIDPGFLHPRGRHHRVYQDRRPASARVRVRRDAGRPGHVLSDRLTRPGAQGTRDSAVGRATEHSDRCEHARSALQRQGQECVERGRSQKIAESSALCGGHGEDGAKMIRGEIMTLSCTSEAASANAQENSGRRSHRASAG